jgi:phage terminase large subunit GpA-like protein
VKGVSRIEDAYEKSDKRRYHVPCPHCEIKSTLKWRQVHWDKDEEGNHLPLTAHYVCEHCGGVWHDHQKVGLMLQGGEWIAENPFVKTAGFHLNELYSPWKSWADVVQDFLDAKNDSEQLKTWTNTSLGETYEESGDQIDDTWLFARREEYPAEVPQGAVVLTMGVDVQEDRLECEVVGYGVGEESWNVDFRILHGDTSAAEVWKDLDDLRATIYEHESGHALNIAATGIDSGYRTQIVYDYVRKCKGQRVYAMKGVTGPGRPIISQSRGKSGGKDRRKVDLYTVGVDDAKILLSSRLKILEHGAGYCHFPVARDEEYFLQLTAEKMVTKYRRGFPYREWVKTRTRNEALDCRIYSHATLKLLNPNWEALVERLPPATDEKEDEPEVETETESATKSHIKRVQSPPRRKGGFVNRW